MVAEFDTTREQLALEFEEVRQEARNSARLKEEEASLLR